MTTAEVFGQLGDPLLVEKIMDEAFPKAIRKHHKKIERLKSHQKDFYWDKILNELKILKDLKLETPY